MNAAEPIHSALERLATAPEGERRGLVAHLTELLYPELKALAHSHLYRWGEPAGAGTTSLVHEAYLRLDAAAPSGFPTRRHFFGAASKTMRSILVDHARHHRRIKRGGGEMPLPLSEATLVSARRSDDVLALEDALVDLERHEPALAEIVELRCFGGLTIDETAEALDVSAPTVKRRWALARAWLYRQLARPGGDEVAGIPGEA